jgi:hypothetical protein
VTRLAASFVLGYHGCDRNIGEQALAGNIALVRSEQDYDWLGPGSYFWEADPERALEWANWKTGRGAYAEPFVIGAVIDLGNCLDLIARENLDLLRWAHAAFVQAQTAAGLPMPENKDIKAGRPGDKLLRYLDCAVIKHLHSMIEAQPDGGYPEVGEYVPAFDTVRGLFTEGAPIYDGGGFYERTHSQIAVRNDACIKGLFIPR